MTHKGEKGGLCGPLTPSLARQGPQGLFKRPDDSRPASITKSMPMRPQGGAPGGFPSATPKPRGSK